MYWSDSLALDLNQYVMIFYKYCVSISLIVRWLYNTNYDLDRVQLFAVFFKFGRTVPVSLRPCVLRLGVTIGLLSLPHTLVHLYSQTGEHLVARVQVCTCLTDRD